MHWKTFVVKIVDFIVAFSFLVLLLFCGFMVVSGAVGNAIITLVVGGVILSMSCGVWIVLSSILENSHKQTQLLQKLVDKLEK